MRFGLAIAWCGGSLYRRALATDQAKAPHFLPCAVFVNLYVTRLQVLNEVPFLVPNGEIQGDLVYSCADGRFLRGSIILGHRGGCECRQQGGREKLLPSHSVTLTR